MTRTHGIRAPWALGGILLLAACETPTRFATDGMPDAAIDALAPRCETPLDIDDDGDVDDRCEGGTDCDDSDPRIGRSAPERCGNGEDDDCDERVDETEGCLAPTGGSCDMPTVVTASSVVAATMFSLPDGSAAACRFASVRAHHLLRVDLAVASSVRIHARSAPGDFAGAAVVHRASCGGAEIACAAPNDAGTGTPLVIPELPAGSHAFEIVSAQTASEGGAARYDVEIEIGPPIAPPPNDECETSTLVPSTYGTHVQEAELVRATAGALSCDATAGRRDVVYRLELASPADVLLVTSALSPGQYGVSVHTGACDAAVEARCIADATRDEVLLRALPAGTHHIVLSGPDSGRARLAITVSGPTAPRPGETCADPLRLVPGVPVDDTFSGRDLDIAETQCGDTYADGTPLRDIVYDFELATTSDVDVVVIGEPITSGGTRRSTASIERVCGAVGTLPAQICSEPLELVSSTTLRTRARALSPGRYFVIVSGERNANVEVRLDTRPAVPPTPVSGNVDCASARTVPTTPGRHVYTGTIAPGGEAVFRFDLPATTRVRVLPSAEVAESTGWTRGCSETAARMSAYGPLDLTAGSYAVFLRNDGSDSQPYEVAFEIGG